MEIIAEKREVFGKKTKSFKYDRKIAAVMFGKNVDPISLTVDQVAFLKVFKSAGETSLVDLNINGTKERVLIKDVQLDPIKMVPIHVSFNKVNLKEKITADIPVHVVGDELNPLVKSGNALVLQLLNEISVEALPTDLPSAFTLDVSKLAQIGDVVTVGQLEYDRTKVEIVDYADTDLVLKLDSAEMKEEETTAEPVSEEELLAKVEATQELSAEEKLAKEAKEKAAKEAKEKDKEKK